MLRRYHHRHSHRRIIFAATTVIILLGIGAVFVYFHRQTEVPTGHGGTPPPAKAALTPDERAYYEYVGPRLHDLVGASQVLAGMGAKKSRNIIVLEKGYNRTTTLIKEIQEYEKTHPVPNRFTAAHNQMTTGMAIIEQAMNEAQTYFLHFQFDKLNPLIAKFEGGTADLTQAAATLDRAGGGTLSTGATPSPTAP